MVHEEIDPRYELEPSDRHAGDVERWQLNLSTDEFKRGALRTWSNSLEIIFYPFVTMVAAVVRCGASPLNSVCGDVAGVVRLIAHERGQEQQTAAPSAAKAAQQNDENRAEVEQRRVQQLERLEMLRYLRILPAKSLQTRVRYQPYNFEKFALHLHPHRLHDCKGPHVLHLHL
jgi:hypothetical protein